MLQSPPRAWSQQQQQRLALTPVGGPGTASPAQHAASWQQHSHQQHHGGGGRGGGAMTSVTRAMSVDPRGTVTLTQVQTTTCVVGGGGGGAPRGQQPAYMTQQQPKQKQQLISDGAFYLHDAVRAAPRAGAPAREPAPLAASKRRRRMEPIFQDSDDDECVETAGETTAPVTAATAPARPSAAAAPLVKTTFNTWRTSKAAPPANEEEDAWGGRRCAFACFGSCCTLRALTSRCVSCRRQHNG
jgi:hypothetical protein